MPYRRLPAFARSAATIAAVATFTALTALVPATLSAAPFGLFQHGGRAMGQVGALTARADEPSAVGYNPAAVAHLEGFQLQAGIDFSSAKDSYSSAAGTFNRTNSIQPLPALYATWKKKENPWAFGLGIDSPITHIEDWRPVFFPGRFLTREFALRLFELHPVVAYDLGDGWSVGGGIRYLKGTMHQGRNAIVTYAVSPSPGAPVTPTPVEVSFETGTDVDGLSWDLGVHYQEPVWGWGAVLRDKAKVDGSGEVRYMARDLPPNNPVLDQLVRTSLQSGTAKESFELPRELRSGIWYAPYPELRLELDASYQMWSSLDETAIFLSRTPVGGPTSLRTPRSWKDTLSLRLAAEGNLTDDWTLYGGVAREPSPVPANRIEPGFPRRDATVYALGSGYTVSNITFDLGYSYHDGGSFSASGQELLNPSRSGTYKTTESVWGFSVRWRF